MIVAAPTTLLADSRGGGRGGLLPRALLVAGSAASLAANVAVAEPTATGRVIAAWPSFALICSCELLMRQIALEQARRVLGGAAFWCPVLREPPSLTSCRLGGRFHAGLQIMD